LRFVMKFGGTSVGDAEAILNAIRIAKDYLQKGNEVVVVTSALAKVTDELTEISQRAVEGNLEATGEFIQKHLKKHTEVARACIHGEDHLRKVLDDLDETMKELSGILKSIARLKELTVRSKDYLLSFGERLSAPILWGAAQDLGLKVQWFTGCDTGITTDENFGEANPLMDITVRNVKAKLEPIIAKGELPIIAGYGACSPHGVSTTLGRGGSDYTATLIGAALDADEVIIWKDVEGLMTADPKIEPNAKVLHRMSYAEASEMAYFGAKAIHPRALQPVMNKQIPVRIRSSFELNNEGTLIAGDREVKTDGVVKAVTVVDRVAMISVTGAGMAGLPGVAAKVFKVMGDADINILMISQSSSEAGISLVVPRNKLLRAKNSLELGLLGTELVKDIVTEDDVCIVAAVGAGMKGSRGVAARVFKAVADRGVNVRMIAQGSSELNISFIVAEEDGPKAIRALHDEFRLDTAQQSLN
jgi:aspartate kinase